MLPLSKASAAYRAGVGSDSYSLQRSRETGVVHLFSLLVPLCFLFTLIFFMEPLGRTSLRCLCTITSLMSISLLAVMLLYNRKGFWSPPAAYLTVFLVFHLGIAFITSIGMSVPGADWTVAWVYRYSTKSAILIVTMSAAAFVLGAMMVQYQRVYSSFPVRAHHTETRSRFLSLSGLIILSISLVYWMYLFVGEGGLEILTGSYAAILRLYSDIGQHTGLIYFGIGLGVVISSAASSNRVQRAAYLLFGLFALFALPLGLRGELLFPAVTALVIRAKRGKYIPVLPTLVFSLLLFSLIAIIKDFRMVGISDYSSAAVSANPFHGLIELGHTLRPVAEVIHWEEQGDERIYGDSYWAPFERIL